MSHRYNLIIGRTDLGIIDNLATRTSVIHDTKTISSYIGPDDLRLITYVYPRLARSININTLLRLRDPQQLIELFRDGNNDPPIIDHSLSKFVVTFNINANSDDAECAIKTLFAGSEVIDDSWVNRGWRFIIAMPVESLIKVFTEHCGEQIYIDTDVVADDIATKCVEEFLTAFVRRKVISEVARSQRVEQLSTTGDDEESSSTYTRTPSYISSVVGSGHQPNLIIPHCSVDDILGIDAHQMFRCFRLLPVRVRAYSREDVTSSGKPQPLYNLLHTA